MVTGGTGGLGAAVVERLLDDGWRVVVPWIMRRARAGQEREGSSSVRRICSIPRRAPVVAAPPAPTARRPLRGVVNLVGGFAIGERVHETPIEEFERQFRSTSARPI